MNAKKFYARDLYLGESPVWDARTERLYLVEIEGGTVLILDFEGRLQQEISLGAQVGSLALTTDPSRIIAAKNSSLIIVNTETGEVRPFSEEPQATQGTRLNDGKPGPDGALYIGSMDRQGKKCRGTLYRVDGGGNFQPLLHDLTISNGLDWSPDEKYFYHIDSRLPLVSRYTFSADAKALGDAHLACHTSFPGELLFPRYATDGLTIDGEGRLWVAMYGSGSVRCFSPAGELLATLKVPAPHVTSCTFGGPGLKALFITTAQENLSAEELSRHPQSGSVFRAEVEVNGKEPYQFQLESTVL